MDFDSLVLISAAEKQPLQLSVSCLRKLSHMVTLFQLMVLSCTLFCLAACGPCLIDELQKSTNYDNCGPFKDDYASGFHDTSISDASASYDLKSPVTHIGINNICSSSHSFCFPSTLPGFSSEEHKFKPTGTGLSGNQSSIGSNRSWFSGSGMFELLNGQTVSCSLNSIEGDQTDITSCRSTNFSPKVNSERPNPGPIDVSLSHCVEFMPPVLDYGHKNLYSPSSALLRVSNLCNDSVLHVYEPFSTDSQFYHCNFSELHIEPGEVASIGVVFLPRSLGFSQAQLILQTSYGGFLIEVKGYAVESPYKISPLLSLNADSGGRLIENLSLFNPLDESLYVKEIIASLSVSQENRSYPIEAICRVEKFGGSDRSSLLTVKDWLVLNSAQAGFPLMAIRPFENWVIGPRSSKTFIEMEFLFESEARIFGAFSVKLARLSRDESDAFLVPVEIDLNGKLAYNGISVTTVGSISVSFKAMGSSNAGNIVVVSLRNRGPHLLSIVEISEFAMLKGFSVKYVQGLLLFPGSVTRVATVTCTVNLCNSAAEMVNLNRNCKLVILTNDSSSPEIEIPCQDIISSCLQHHDDSTVGFDLRSLKARSGNERSGSLDGDTWLPSKSSGSESTEADEFILDNWKSQGISTNMSVLGDNEIVFPVLRIGTQQSKWITVKNPSKQPVVMQLILNSGQIIDQCRGTDPFSLPISLVSSAYGFSMADSAQTEALVHPNGMVSFGPIFFHPSNPCHWTSTALIRNNLSGVEWLTLKGQGGSLSLAIFEGPEPVKSIEFSLGLPFPLNVSSLDMEETNCAFSRSVIKELYAKNTGDLPLTVNMIRVSGSECELDGFMVHNCNSFSLEPGESTKLLVSYQSNFHLESLQRDLELVLASGVLVVPMKASLSLFMFNVCKQSVFWIRLKKFSAVLFLSASMVFLILFCFSPQFSSQDHFYRTTKTSAKPEMESLLKSAAKRKPVKQNPGPKYPNSPLGESISVQNQTLEDDRVIQSVSPESLTVRIGKEKNRRRKKRKGAPNSLSGLFEVSSSQSGNSTPSSPLSPASSTPNHRRSESPEKSADVAANPFTQPSTQTRPTVHANDPPMRPTVKESKLKISTDKKPVLQNSATFPSPRKAVSGLLASTSRVAPHARAPGPRTRDPRKVEKAGDEHTYDIWGDHFSGLHLVGNLKDVSTRKIATENSSSSFFVMDPLALVTKNGNCFQEEG